MGRGWFFEFFMGFNDFKMLKVCLLRLMPVYVGLSMVSLGLGISDKKIIPRKTE
jgi:hypothetical protein